MGCFGENKKGEAIYKGFIYGSLTRALNAWEERSLEVFHLKCLNRIYGLRHRYKSRQLEIRGCEGNISIMEKVNENVLKGFVNEERISNEGLINRVYMTEEGESKARGRSHVRQGDDMTDC